MRLTELQFDDAKPVEGYGPGFFRIAGEALAAPLIVTASGTRTWTGYDDIDVLLEIGKDVDVIFFGTGDEIAHLPKDLKATLEHAGIGVEAMNSPAACRTYNVLVSEGRRVAAALLPVGGAA